MRIGLLLLLLASLCVPVVAQQPSTIRSVATLPGTCRGGNANQPTDEVVLISGLVGTKETCDASGIWVPDSEVVDILKYGNTDLCVSLTAAKTQNLNSPLDARGFASQGVGIKCSVSTYVSGYKGQIELPNGTINLQTTLLLQTRSDVTGQGEDATIILACAPGNPYCNGVFFPTSSTPTTPVVAWTDDGVTPDFNSHPTFDTRLTRVYINCANVSGLIGLANYVAQENKSGPEMVSISGCGNHGIAYNWGGANVIRIPGTPVQTTNISQGTCTSCTTTMSSPVAAGDTIVVCGEWGTSGGLPTLTSVTDSIANPYTLIPGSLATDGNFKFQCAYAQSVTASSSVVIVFNFSGATASFNAIQGAEHNHLTGLFTALDQVAVAVSTTANPTCPSITTTPSNALVICAAAAETVGVAYTAGTTGGCASSACHLAIGTTRQGWEWLVKPTAGAIALNFTSSSVLRAFTVSMSFLPGTNNGPGSQNHVIDGLSAFIANGETATSDSYLIWGDTGGQGIAGPKTMNNVTATVNTGFVGTAPAELVRISGGFLDITGLHLENCGSTAPSAGLALGEDAGVKNIRISNLNGGQFPTCNTLLFISNAFPASSTITVENLGEGPPNQSVNLMVDQLTGCTDPIASENGLAFYAIGYVGSIARGYSRISSSGTVGCQTLIGSLLYQIDDGPECVRTAGGGTADCTSGSLVNPTPGFPEILTALGVGLTSVTIVDNGIGPNTIPSEVIPAPWASSKLGLTCVQPATYTPSWKAVTTVTPYVAGTTLGSLVVTVGTPVITSPYCFAIVLKGFDQ